jgi:acyl-CoA synthetase (AMP-forming)/AMP-acid ligase II
LRTLAAAFAHTLARRGNDAAVLFEGARFTFADIDRRVRSVAAAVTAAGVKPGDRVAVGLNNSPDLIAFVLGVIRAGAVLVPLNPAYSADEVLYAVGDSGARMAVVEPEHAAILEAARLPGLSVMRGGFVPESQTAPIEAGDDAEATVLIVYTSGTTGRPKGVMLSHRALLTNLTTVARAWRCGERPPAAVAAVLSSARARPRHHCQLHRRLEHCVAPALRRRGDTARSRALRGDDVLRRTDDVQPPGESAGRCDRRQRPQPHALVGFRFGSAERGDIRTLP